MDSQTEQVSRAGAHVVINLGPTAVTSRENVLKVVLKRFHNWYESRRTNVNTKRDVQDCGEKRKNKLLKYRGFLFAILSSLCFSLGALIVKYLKDDYERINLAVWRFQGAFVPSIPLVLLHHCTKDRKTKEEEPEKCSRENCCKILMLLMARSTLTTTAFLLNFYALKYLPLGDVLVISSTAPVFAYTIAFIVLKEPCGLVPLLASLTSLAGVVFISRPPVLSGAEQFDYGTLVGTALALSSSLLAAISNCILRYSRSIHYTTATCFFGAWGTLESIIVAFALSSQGSISLPRGVTDWILGVLLALLTFVGHIGMILALKYERAGPVTLIRSIDIPFGFLGQVVFWKVVPDIHSCIGAVIVVFGVVVIGLRKYARSLSIDDIWRKRLHFLMN